MDYLQKKLTLFIFLIVQGTLTLGFSTSLEFYNAWDFNKGDGTTGGRYKFPYGLGELRLTVKGDSYNFGLTATNQKLTKHFPFYLKCGNLSASGILSKMNSPTLSASAAPFASSVSSAVGLAASLPGYSTFSRPMSLFSQTGLAGRLSNTNLACWYSPQEEKIAFSFIESLRPSKDVAFALSLAGGFFPYNQSSQSDWFSASPFYPAGSHFASALQFSSQLYWWKSFFMCGLNETPFGSAALWFRSENRLSGEHFSFTGAAFFNGDLPHAPNISAGAKVLSPQLQLKGNLQYKTLFKAKHFPVFVKSGFTAYSGISLEDENHEVRFGYGSQFLFPRYLLTLSLLTKFDAVWDYTASVPGTITLNFDDASLQIKNVWYLAACSPSLSLLVSVDSVKVVAALAVGVGQSAKISASGSYTTSTSANKFSFYINASYIWRKIKCTCKLGFAFEG